MLVGNKTDLNNIGLSTIPSGIPQIQSLWGRFTNAVYSEKLSVSESRKFMGLRLQEFLTLGSIIILHKYLLLSTNFGYHFLGPSIVLICPDKSTELLCLTDDRQGLKWFVLLAQKT